MDRCAHIGLLGEKLQHRDVLVQLAITARFNQHPLVAAIRVPRVDGDAVVHIEREGVGRVVEKDGGGLRLTATGEEDEVAVETAKVLDVQTVVHVDAVIARQTMLDELLVAVEELADQFRVGLNAGRKHDELVVLAHRLQKMKHVGSKTQVHLVRLAIADLRSTALNAGTWKEISNLSGLSR